MIHDLHNCDGVAAGGCRARQLRDRTTQWPNPEILQTAAIPSQPGLSRVRTIAEKNEGVLEVMLISDRFFTIDPKYCAIVGCQCEWRADRRETGAAPSAAPARQK